VESGGKCEGEWSSNRFVVEFGQDGKCYLSENNDVRLGWGEWTQKCHSCRILKENQQVLGSPEK
jgi:hypothetical protein